MLPANKVLNEGDYLYYSVQLGRTPRNINPIEKVTNNSVIWTCHLNHYAIYSYSVNISSKYWSERFIISGKDEIYVSSLMIVVNDYPTTGCMDISVTITRLGNTKKHFNSSTTHNYYTCSQNYYTYSCFNPLEFWWQILYTLLSV